MCLFCATVTSFSPSSQLVFVQRDPRYVSSSSDHQHHYAHHLGRSSKIILNLSDYENNESKISPVQRIGILIYRFALAMSALLVSGLALVDSQFLEGTGLVLDDNFSRSYLPVAAGLSLIMARVPQVSIQVSTTIVGTITIAFGITSTVLSSSGDPTIDNIAWTLWILSLMAVSIREIWYFGGEYKKECGITLFMLPLMLDPNTTIPFTIPLCALGMSVLAAGKLFEPCIEDLERSQSEFLVK